MATQYKAEYAKSGRSSCKKCSKAIPDGALRIGPLVQSPHFDGKVPLWHHFECLAAKAVALIDAAQVDGYFGLRPEHQTQIDDLIAANRNPKAVVKEDKKAAKASKELSEIPGEINVEAAKSGRSSCRKCFDSIAQVWPPKTKHFEPNTCSYIVFRAPSASDAWDQLNETASNFPPRNGCTLHASSPLTPQPPPN
jgi:hypothetical protein